MDGSNIRRDARPIGEGFIKLLYDRELPTELLKALMQARVEVTKRLALVRTTAELGNFP